MSYDFISDRKGTICSDRLLDIEHQAFGNYSIRDRAQNLKELSNDSIWVRYRNILEIHGLKDLMIQTMLQV